ncbi:MAG: MBL fold metallo-hydrolase [Candidatus Aenigmatarchaeota archaeon]
MEEKTIIYKNGISINQKYLLDPLVADLISFVSHAHIDHAPYLVVKKPFATEETIDLIQVRDKNFIGEKVKYNKKYNIDNISFEFFDSKHILGSAMIYLELDGNSILYTSDLRTTEFNKDVDILIIESTFGSKEYIFPNREEEIERLIKFIREKVDILNKKVEIGAYPLGKAQEIIKILNDYGYIPSATKTIEKFNEIYRKYKIKLKTSKNSQILIRSMNEVVNNPLEGYYHAFCSGWALVRKFENIEGFIISDHLDFNGLIEFVKNINPKKIYTVHGFSEIFANELRKMGFNAQPLI